MKDGWVDGISKQMSTHIFNNIQARVLVPLAFVTLFSPGLCHQCTEHFPPTVHSAFHPVSNFFGYYWQKVIE